MMKVSISGVRGVYGQDLTLNEVSRFSSLFAGIAGPKCVLARDTRPSGRIISQVVSASLTSSGVDVYDLGVAPTPATFREARKHGAGVMVTASHNPLEWNGLKFIVQGRGLFEDELDRMLASKPAAGGFGNEHAATTTYVDDVAAHIGAGDSKVAIDCGGGASCGYAEQLFKKLGMKYVSINGVSGISSRGPDPTVDELSDLRAAVTANKLDFGFALDPDGDRLVVVKEGEKLGPDATMLLCVAKAAEMGAKKFVSSIDSSVAIDRYVQSRGGSIEHSKVGEANVVKKMLETGAEAGGEGSSAGFIMPKFNMCRDGLLAAATIATLDKKTIADCLARAFQFSQIRSKVPADSSLHAKVIEKLPEMLKAEATELILGDGVKAIIDDDSWALVRPSNTEHAIRVSVESRSGKAESLFKKVSEKVQRAYDQAK
jgi:phosphomannomutase